MKHCNHEIVLKVFSKSKNIIHNMFDFKSLSCLSVRTLNMETFCFNKLRYVSKKLHLVESTIKH